MTWLGEWRSASGYYFGSELARLAFSMVGSEDLTTIIPVVTRLSKFCNEFHLIGSLPVTDSMIAETPRAIEDFQKRIRAMTRARSVVSGRGNKAVAFAHTFSA